MYMQLMNEKFFVLNVGVYVEKTGYFFANKYLYPTTVKFSNFMRNHIVRKLYFFLADSMLYKINGTS